MQHRTHTRAVASKVRRAVSRAREQRGREAPTYDDELDAIAQAHAEAMARTGKLTHELHGETPQDRASAYSQVGENVHRQTIPVTDIGRTARATVTAWLESPAHRQNMLREEATTAGVGAAQAGDDVYVCLLLSTGKKIQTRVSERVNALF
jgi:uncharacterized protein YkwD